MHITNPIWIQQDIPRITHLTENENHFFICTELIEKKNINVSSRFRYFGYRTRLGDLSTRYIPIRTSVLTHGISRRADRDSSKPCPCDESNWYVLPIPYRLGQHNKPWFHPKVQMNLHNMQSPNNYKNDLNFGKRYKNEVLDCNN